MRIIFTRKDKPKDYGFMEESEKVLKDTPKTWKAYPKNVDGAMSIIEMEHKELLNATDKSHELVHLASACLYAWRMINDKQ